MDSLVKLCARSIIRNISGDLELSRELAESALKKYKVYEFEPRIEDHIPGKVKENYMRW